jgi:hypothetical protein
MCVDLWKQTVTGWCETLRNRKLSLLVLCTRYRFVESIEILCAGQVLFVWGNVKCAQNFSLNGKGHYVFGVDEMVMLKLMLKLYGTGMSILCNWLSTVINKWWKDKKQIMLILSEGAKCLIMMSDFQHLTANLASCNYRYADKSRKETSYSDRRFWYSYILFFIIMEVKILVLIYITRLASNEIFSPSNKIYREVGRAKGSSTAWVGKNPSLLAHNQ